MNFYISDLHLFHKNVTRAGDSILRAYNVGCMMPYMEYEPRTLEEIVENGVLRVYRPDYGMYVYGVHLRKSR